MQPNTRDPEESRRHLAEAEQALTQGDRIAAKRALERAAGCDPDNDELPLLAAMLCLEDQEFEAAAKFALQSIAVRPFHPAAMNLIAVACMDSGHADIARSILERARKMAPSLTKIKKNLREAKHTDRRQRNSKKQKKTSMPVKAIRELAASREPSLGVAIVLSEGQENRLSTCVDSIRDVAAEIVVADARSNPCDIELPRGVDAAVRSTAVGAAATRNEAIGRLRTDWVLLLDANESLPSDSVPAVEQALTDPAALCRWVELREICHPRLVIRLVRNVPGLGYHELFDGDLLPTLLPFEKKWGLAIAESEIAIERHSERPKLRSRPGEELLERIERDDEDEAYRLRARIERAGYEIESQSPDAALAHLREARKILAEDRRRMRPLELEEIVTAEALCLMRLERYKELDRLTGEYNREHSPTAATLFFEGSAARGVKDPERAATALRRALQEKDNASFVRPPAEVTGPGLPNLLGAALIDVGDLEQAKQAFDQALAIDPGNLQASLGWLGILHSEQEFEEMLEKLDGLTEAHGNDPTLWIAGAILLAGVPQLAMCNVLWLEEGLARFPDHPDLCRRLGEAHLSCGSGEKALEFWKHLSLPAAPAAQLAAALASGSEIPDVPDEYCEAAGSELVAWFHRWLVCGAIEALDRALVDITRAEDQVPGVSMVTASWLDKVGQPDAAAGVRTRLRQQS